MGRTRTADLALIAVLTICQYKSLTIIFCHLYRSSSITFRSPSPSCASAFAAGMGREIRRLAGVSRTPVRLARQLYSAWPGNAAGADRRVQPIVFAGSGRRSAAAFTHPQSPSAPEWGRSTGLMDAVRQRDWFRTVERLAIFLSFPVEQFGGVRRGEPQHLRTLWQANRHIEQCVDH